DYPDLFTEGEERERASLLSSRVVHVSEFLVRQKGPASPAREGKKTRVTCHSSCHLRAAGGAAFPRQLLQEQPGMEFVEMADADRCAGGAGTFCIKNPDQSELIFRRKEKAVLESGAEMVVTSCPACMIQLKSGLKGTGVQVKHIAQIFDE
ncbi:MAG TPA: (Fe-S)-binding protein, partial [Nitrospiria bacterium]|nr:(Fe-S)-binding protein [Nitrospiria bacterium]